MKRIATQGHKAESCATKRRAVQDTLDAIGGKWKLLLLLTLQAQPLKFNELVRELGISPRVLSRELRELEASQLVSRTALPTVPATVEYAITAYGLTLSGVLEVMRDWGTRHRARIIHAPGQQAASSGS